MGCYAYKTGRFMAFGHNNNSGQKRQQRQPDPEFQYKMMRWMMGRYGVDGLTQALMIVAAVLVVVNFFISSTILSFLALALMVYGTFRMLSRNIPARTRELHAFDSVMVKPRAWWARRTALKMDASKRQADRNAAKTAERMQKAVAREARKNERDQKRANKRTKDGAQQTVHEGDDGVVIEATTIESDTLTFTCSQCGQSLSVPKGKGMLKITCPKCGNQTIKKS